MNTAQPIRDKKQLEQFKKYYYEKDYNLRNHLLLTIGLNTALRISDILSLRWKEVYDFKNRQFFSHLSIVEQKTHKKTCIYLNKSLLAALTLCKNYLCEEGDFSGEKYLFETGKGTPLSRIQAWRIVKNAAEGCGISGSISPHSLRKTFGYQAWKKGVPPVLLMEIYNHSSFDVTQRYLGIEQEDRDAVFEQVCI